MFSSSSSLPSWDCIGLKISLICFSNIGKIPKNVEGIWREWGNALDPERVDKNFQKKCLRLKVFEESSKVLKNLIWGSWRSFYKFLKKKKKTSLKAIRKSLNISLKSPFECLEKISGNTLKNPSIKTFRKSI